MIEHATGGPGIGAGTPAGKPANLGAGRLDFLDGIRGIAAAMVVVCHLPYFTVTPPLVVAAGLGNPWVTIFITLSGFCLFLPAAGRARLEMPRPFWDFMRRRARRIVPAWYAALLLCAVVGWMFAIAGYQPGLIDPASAEMTRYPGAFLPQDWWDLVTHLTLTHSMTRYSGSINGPGYTLGTEWQLYLLMLPFLFIARRWGWAALIVIVVVLALPFPTIVGKIIPKVFSPAFTLPFIIGMGAARLSYRLLQEHHSRLLRSAPVLGVASALFAAGYLVLRHRDGFSWLPLGEWFPALATASLCILMVTNREVGPARILGSRPAKLVGDFSYSLYLTHFPLLAALAFLAQRLGVPDTDSLPVIFLPGLVFIFGFAYVFHLAFERPFLSYRPRASSSPARAPQATAAAAEGGSGLRGIAPGGDGTVGILND